ncbi:MAG: hypothetical protein HY286_09675 [Planctomycetes bacterium]|nr:hypothetical protein [Planctomycetota bacterium]
MTPISVLCTCGKSYSVPSEKAGKRFKCVTCGASLLVESPVESAASAPPIEETAPPSAPATTDSAKSQRPSAAAARRAHAREAAPKKSPLPLVLGGIAVVAALGIGAFFMFGGPGKEEQAKQAAAEQAKIEAAKPKDPIVEKKAELTKRLAEAEKQQNPVMTYLDIATFCLKDPKLEADAKKIYEKVIAKDPGNTHAHEGLGHKQYDGDTAEYKGKWVDAARLAELTAADAKRREEEEKLKKIEEERASDPFVIKAKDRIAEMQGMINEVNAFADKATKDITDESEPDNIDKIRKSDSIPATFKFFYACKEVPKPYLLAVQDKGFNPPESWARSMGEILDGLRRTFYKRYENVVQLRNLMETPVPVWIFRSKGQYERWRRCGHLDQPGTAFVAAFYTGTNKNSTSGMLHIWLRDSHEEKNFIDDPIAHVIDTVWHEGTHQLMDFNSNSRGRGFGAGNMPWMEEGFAEYVGTHKSQPVGAELDHYYFGMPNIGRKNEIYNFGEFSKKSTLGDAVEANPSLKEVVHLDYLQFWIARSQMEGAQPGVDAQRARLLVSGTYAYGWALCHFLQHADNGKYRDRFHKWFDAELTKKASGQYFDELFGLDTDEKWSAFELEFQDWLCITMRQDFNHVADDKINNKYMKEFDEACVKK